MSVVLAAQANLGGRGGSCPAFCILVHQPRTVEAHRLGFLSVVVRVSPIVDMLILLAWDYSLNLGYGGR
jgi:hypothetical protein